MYTKYTKEILTPLVCSSLSVAEVVRKLGKKLSGSTQTHIAKRIRDFGIDSSHFLGCRSNCGSRHIGGMEKIHWSEILVLRTPDQHREKSYRLKRALIESGVKYECSNENCLVKNIWIGKSITLDVHHVDGNFLDCRKNNLKFLCPNCHSQTDSHRKRK